MKTYGIAFSAIYSYWKTLWDEYVSRSCETLHILVAKHKS